MDIITIIAVLVAVGMIGGALMGWLVTLVLITDELIGPYVHELLHRRRSRAYPSPSQVSPRF